MRREHSIIWVAVVAAAVLAPALSHAGDLSRRGAQILDRFDKKKSDIRIDEPLARAVGRPIKLVQVGRARPATFASSEVDRFLRKHEASERSLTTLLEPFPDGDKGHPRYRKAMAWLDSYRKVLAGWKSEYEQMIAGEQQSGSLRTEYLAERKPHDDLLLYLKLAKRHPGDKPDVDRAVEMHKRVAAGELAALAVSCQQKYQSLGERASDCELAVDADTIMKTHLQASAQAIVGERVREVERATGVYREHRTTSPALLARMVQFDAELAGLDQAVGSLYAALGTRRPEALFAPLRAARDAYMKAIDDGVPSVKRAEGNNDGAVKSAAAKAIGAWKVGGSGVQVKSVRATTDWQVEVNALGVPVYRMKKFVAVVEPRLKGFRHCLQVSGGAGHSATGRRKWAKLVAEIDTSGVSVLRCK